MPGPYSRPQGVSIVGGGGSGVSKKNIKKHKNVMRKAMDKPMRKAMTPMPTREAMTPMPTRKAMTPMKEAMTKKLALPVWQDRDVKNRGTKLNP